MIIHCSDFAGTVMEFQYSRVWSERVNKEFEAQFNEEGKMGIPQTPYLKDLNQLHVLAKGESGFIKYIVLPLWKTFNTFQEG